MNTIKKYKGAIIISIVILAFALFVKDLSLIVLLAYGLGIYLLIVLPIHKKLRATLAVIIWVAFIMVSGLFYYSNHYFPRGPLYDTGDVVCQYDDISGPCREKYIEDTRELNIPEWGRFFKSSSGEFLWLVLLFAGIAISTKKEASSEETFG